jgi:KTSC domain-containing protein
MAIEVISHAPSTNIAGVTYDTETQTLTISFLKGGVCEYYEVDETTAHGFEQALSATKYMNAYVENVFPSQRLI